MKARLAKAQFCRVNSSTFFWLKVMRPALRILAPSGSKATSDMTNAGSLIVSVLRWLSSAMSSADISDSGIM